MKVKIVSVEEHTCPYCKYKYNSADDCDIELDVLVYGYTCENCGRAYEDCFKLNFLNKNVGVGLCDKAELGIEIEMEELD